MSDTTRGFAKNNKDANFQKELLKHHLARMEMMLAEERGEKISYEDALKKDS
jgi:hypothetical protein